MCLSIVIVEVCAVWQQPDLGLFFRLRDHYLKLYRPQLIFRWWVDLTHLATEKNLILLWLWISFRKSSLYCLGFPTSHTRSIIEKYNIVSIISLPVKTVPCWSEYCLFFIKIKTELGAQVSNRYLLIDLLPVPLFIFNFKQNKICLDLDIESGGV